MTVDELKQNPYRVFFPIAAFGAVSAVGVWLRFFASQMGWLGPDIYPALLHSEQAIALFVLPVVAGFLCTAVPRFTATAFPTRELLIGLGALFLSLAAVSWMENRSPFRFMHFVVWALLASFGLPRIWKGAQMQVVHLLETSLVLGALGTLLIFISDQSGAANPLRWGRLLLHFGTLPLLILGAGSILIVPSASPVDRNAWRSRLFLVTKGKARAFAVGFAATFVIDFAAFGSDIGALTYVGPGIRLVMAAYWIDRYFHIREVRAFKGALAAGFWTASLLFLAGLGGFAFFPEYAIHFAHLYFVGGISVFVFCVTIHVLISHGGFGPEGARSWVLWVILVLIVGAALTRATAPLMPKAYVSHLAYASLLFIVAVILWFVRFVRLAFHSNVQETHRDPVKKEG